tara:strand:- start:826 stop:2622 length:1797 start_codon:yes stop_codon:yes gene_type:complete
MAAPKFDTTVVKPTYPGLTYKVDKAMPAKFNNMEAILGIAEMGIKKADEIDKSNTINEANDLGNVLADEIENSSPSYLNSLEQDKLRLEEEVKNNPEDLEIQADLNAITTRYSNANAQGMSKYESERRILQKTQELANANPAYADEIALRVSKTLGNRGVTSLMEQDNLLYTNQLKKQNADNKIIDDYLRTKPGVTPMFMEDEDRKIAYLTYKKIDREEAEILQKIEDGSIRSKENIAEVQNKIDLSGGIHQVAGNKLLGFTNELNNIADRLTLGEIDYKEARREKNLKLLSARKFLSVIGSLEQTDENKAAYAQFDKYITDLETDSDAELSGGTLKTRLNNVNSSIKAQQEFGRLASGTDETSLRLQDLKIKSYNFLVNDAKLSFKPGQKNAMINEILNFGMIEGRKFAIDSPYFAEYNKNGLLIQKTLAELDPVAKEYITTSSMGNKMSPDLFGLYNNIYNTAEHYKNPKERYQYEKTLLTSMNNMDDTVFKYMLTNSETFLDDTTKELGLFLGGITNEVSVNKVDISSIQINEAGVFYSSDNVNARRVAEKLNIASTLNSKLGEMKVTKETSLQLLETLKDLPAGQDDIDFGEMD